MRLLDLVEKDDLVRPPAHGFRERAAFLVSDVSGRRADQAGYRMLLHVLGHVDAQHGRVVLEHEFGQRLRQLGLAHAGRAEEDEGADRTVGVLEARPRTAHGPRNSLDGFALPDDPRADLVLHAHKPLALALHHLVHGNSRPARHDGRDVFGQHGLFHHAGSAVDLGFRDGALQFGDFAIGQLARLLVVGVALRDGQLVAHVLQLLLEVGGVAELALFRLPPRRHG